MAFATPDTPMRPDIAAFLKAIAEHFSGERVDVHPPSDYGQCLSLKFRARQRRGPWRASSRAGPV